MISRRAMLMGSLGAATLRPPVASAQAPSLDLLSRAIGSKRSRLLQAQLTLAKTLIFRLAKDVSADSNIVVSPASLANMFAMLDLGASSRMQAALHRCLGFDSSGDVSQDFDGVRTVAADFSKQDQGDGPLASANMLIFDPSTRPTQLALLGLAAAGADVFVENLDRTDSIQKINDWIKQKTMGKIREVLNEAPADLGLVAVNALYFKDQWKNPFDRADTALAKFHVSSKRSIDVLMMRLGQGYHSFRSSERFMAVELPFATAAFKLVIIVQKERASSARSFNEAWSWLKGDGFTKQRGELGLPRFSLSSQVELLSHLDQMGLADARIRNDSLAGFSRVPQHIARLLQKTVMKVSEEGTEAAAASAAMTVRSVSLEENYAKMIVDKPFLFALRDDRTGFVLLSGYVASLGSGVERN